MEIYKSLVFPFTHVEPETAIALHRRLGRFLIYQPSVDISFSSIRDLEQNGIVSIRYPEAGNEIKAEKLLSGYMKWGENLGPDASIPVWMELMRRFEQEFVSDLKGEIKGSKKVRTAQPDNQMKSWLVLSLAHMLDAQRLEAARLEHKAETTLGKTFAALRGEEGEIKLKKRIPRFLAEDPGVYYPEARISAWMKIYQADTILSMCLVTWSVEIMMLVLDKLSETVSIKEISPNDVKGYILMDHQDGFMTKAYLAEDISKNELCKALGGSQNTALAETDRRGVYFVCVSPDIT